MVERAQKAAATQRANKTLVIAEKPSVAGDIARALGGMKRHKDFYEGGEYIISSAIGHLLEINAPDKFEPKRGKWNLSNLPVIPDYFDLLPIRSAEPRLQLLGKLYRRPDIATVINACDAGREGELIFFNLMRYLNEKAKQKELKPVHRLWLSSMTPESIRTGFKKLRENEEMRPLQSAAVCRAEADWLIGINATRAMTALRSTGGGFHLTTVGRVQTPTLAILVEREAGIKKFEARDYWEVRATFAAQGGEYEGLWIDGPEAKAASKAASKAAKGEKDKDAKPERIFDVALAEKIVKECKGHEGLAKEKTKPSSESPPPLFDLTSLQREANMRFGMPARATLGAAQALYERHKMITYPRTDSRALPEDYPATVRKTLTKLSKSGHALARFAGAVVQKNMVNGKNRKIFNNGKVSDHFAIIPTGEIRPKLKEIEEKIYRLILTRFISAFYPAAKYKVTERRTTMNVSGHVFLTKGKVLVAAGWREVGGQTPKDAALPPLAQAVSDNESEETVKAADVCSDQKTTLPPPRYSEATLLAAMEGAGKFVDDEELREAMRERGMGTPATRASIIEGLMRERYLLRDGRELVPMPKAESLLRLLSALNVEDLTKPAMTGEWEHKLRRMENNEFGAEEFMKEIRALSGKVVQAAQACGEVENIAGDYATLKAKCPACKGEVRENFRRFSCQKCEFFIWKDLSGREFSVEEAETLLHDGQTAKLEGFRSRLGREFSAEAVLRKEAESGLWKVLFDFDRGVSDLTPEQLREKPGVGSCPKCGSEVRDVENRYMCEVETCDFSLSRFLLQREMKPEEVTELLRVGKTALLAGFISKKNRRPFSAHLTINLAAKNGKLGFEFAPRKDTHKPLTSFKKKGVASDKAAKPKTTRTTTRRTATKTSTRRQAASAEV